LQPAPGKETVMKPLLLCSITLIGSSMAFAQPPARPETAAAPRTITLTGCVGGGGANAQPVTLTSAMIIPTTEQAGAVTPSPVPGSVSSTPTHPASPARTPGTAGAVGTSGTVVAGTAPAGSSASSISGYRLSGTDMSAWMGRRVQIIGSLVPAAPGAAPATPAAIGAVHIGPDGSLVLPEFRVVSVSPVTGECPRP
jgi:hypothetical protein